MSSPASTLTGSAPIPSATLKARCRCFSATPSVSSRSASERKTSSRSVILDQNSEQDIARFIGRNTNMGGDLVGIDAALDYPLFNNLKPTVKGFAAPTAVVGM